jgi:hypothetical protein
MTRMTLQIPARSTSTDSTTFSTDGTPRTGRTRSVMPELMPAGCSGGRAAAGCGGPGRPAADRPAARGVDRPAEPTRELRERVEGRGVPAPGQRPPSTDELDRLGGVRQELDPIEVRDRAQGDCTDGAGLDPAVTAGPHPAGGPDLTPRRWAQATVIFLAVSACA